MQAVLCIVHCNEVSKPVKGKYLLLCMNSIMYLLLTWHALIMFLKVLSHLILKIKSFMKYFKKGVLKYFKIFMKFLNISKWNISSCISRRECPHGTSVTSSARGLAGAIRQTWQPCCPTVATCRRRQLLRLQSTVDHLHRLRRLCRGRLRRLGRLQCVLGGCGLSLVEPAGCAV